MAKRHTEDQIIAVLKESVAGVKTSELCRRHNINETTSNRKDLHHTPARSDFVMHGEVSVLGR